MSQNNFEAVTVQLQKSALAYIRFKAELNKVSVEKQLQIEVMDIQNAEFEPSPKWRCHPRTPFVLYT